MKEQKISLLTAILLNMNIMIGSGVLIGTGASAMISGNASFLSWPLVALFFLPIVLCIIELSKLFPGAGGFYLYAKQGLNRTAGFISGWLYVVGYTFAACVEVLALRKTMMTTVGENFITSSSLLFNSILLAIVLGMSLLSMRFVSNFLNSLTIVKILPLIILIGILPFIFNPSFAVSATELSLLPASLALPIFGYFGFEYCVGLSHLIKDSEKNAPRAILIGFLATGLLYMLFHFGLLNLMGASGLAQFGAPAFADFITLPIPYLKALLKILIPAASILTLFAGLLGMINTNAILLQTWAKEKLFKGGSILQRTTGSGRPVAALLLQFVIVLLITVLIPNIERVGGLTILAVFLSFLLPVISLLMIQKRNKSYKKLPITILGLILVSCLSIYSWYTLCPELAQRMVYTFVLLALIGIGYIIYTDQEKVK